MGSRVNASLLCMSAGVKSGCAPGKSDQAPAGEVLVAAIDRVGEHAFHGVGAQRVEERLRGRPGEARRLALLERGDHFVLLCARVSRANGLP